MAVAYCEPGDDGWLIEWEDTSVDGGPFTGYVHVTAEWVEEMRVHQYRPNRRDETLLNRLAWHLRGDDPDAVAEAFAAAYTDVVTSRRARAAVGLKAVTSHGDEDLEAVIAGAPVRPWNAANPDTPVRDFARRRRANRTPRLRREDPQAPPPVGD